MFTVETYQGDWDSTLEGVWLDKRSAQRHARKRRKDERFSISSVIISHWNGRERLDVEHWMELNGKWKKI